MGIVIDLAEYRRRKEQALLRVQADDPPQQLVDSVLGPNTTRWDWDEHDLGAAAMDLAEYGSATVTQFGLAKALADAYPNSTLEGIPGHSYTVTLRSGVR